MHNGMIQFTGEKMAKSVGNIALLHEVLAEHGPEAVVMYLISGHYRQPLAYSEAALAQAPANVKRIREAVGDCPGRSPRTAPLRDAFFDALAPTSTRRGARGPVRVAPGGIGRAGSAATPTCVRCSSVLGLEALLDGRRAGAGGGRGARRSSASRPAPARLRGRRPAARWIAALGWEVRDGPGGFELIPL